MRCSAKSFGLAMAIVVSGVIACSADPRALFFDGTNDYVTFGAATNLNNLGVSNLTVECWFKREGTGKLSSTGSGGIYAVPLVTKGMAEQDGDTRDCNWFFGVGTNSSGQAVLAADFEDMNNGLNHPVRGITVVGTNVWVHGAVTYDVAGSNWVLYVNGVPDTTNVLAGITNVLMLYPRYDSRQHAALASSLLSSGVTNSSSGFFRGVLDEVRVWNYARSAQEIADSYKLPIATAAGLIARWGLDQTSGIWASNSISGGVTGMLTNGPVWTNGYVAELAVSVSSPTNGSTLVGDWTLITATAYPGTGASITNVEFYVGETKLGEDTTAPYTVNWCGIAPAVYSLTAVAMESSGARATSAVASVTVNATPTSGALQFNGTNTYVTFGPAPELGLSMFTIECWFKRTGVGKITTTGTGGVTDAIPLVTKGRGEAEASNVDMNWFLGISTNNNVLAADFEEGIGGTSLGLNHPVFGSTPVASNTWYHAAATYDGARWALYLNGNPEAALEVNQPPRSDSIQHAALASALRSTGAAEGFFQGLLDEVRIWSYARSADQIAESYNQQVTNQPGLRARWSLNEGTGSVVRNSQCGGVNGDFVSSPVWSTDSFDANHPPSVSITNPANDALVSGSSLTIEAAADDADGAVTNVQFYNGSTLVGSDATAPYTVVWDDVYPGAYALKAVATDNLGLSATSTVVTVTVTPPPGAGGVYFDGKNDYITFGEAAGLGVTNFTIECWFRMQGAGRRANTGAGGVYALPLVSKGMAENEAGATNMNYFFGIGTNGTGQAVLAADFEDMNNGLNHPVRGTALVASNEWQHGAVTYDTAGSNWVLYLNGLPDTTNVVTGPTGITNLLMVIPRYDSIQHAALGSCLQTSGTTNADTGFFAGRLDEVRIWNYARSAQEIADAYQTQISAATGLIGRWSLDDGDGLAVTNSGTSGISGRLTNGPVWVEGYAFVPPPVITNQPASQSVECGQTATFTVGVSTTGSVTYQWYRGASLLAGRTEDTLSLTNVSETDAGTYSVIVRNVGGATNSEPAVLKIVDTTAPVISVCATNQTIAADTNCQALIPDLTPQVVASDSCSAITTSQAPAAGTIVGLGDTVVTLTIIDAATNQASCTAKIRVVDSQVPHITAHPRSATNIVGTTVAFAVTATSCSPVGYQWMFGETRIAGENTATMTITNAESDRAGDYRVILTNAAGAATSDVATLTMLLPAAPALSASATLLPNGHFRAVFSGTPNVPYTVKYAEDLLGAWEMLTNITSDSSGLIEIDDYAVPTPAIRFYRVVYP